MASLLDKDIQLLDVEQYIIDLVHHVQKAQERITIMSLIITDDTATHDLIKALLDAAKRGVVVTIAADTYTYSELGGAFSPFKRLTKQSRAASETAQRFVQAGASFTWLGNIFKLNPFAGVTHSKWSIVDDTCYLFGGVNLYKDGIESIDYMFRIVDQDLAHRIAKEHGAIIQNENQSTPYSGYIAKSRLGTIHIDSGKSGDSPIYERACALARDAKDILFVSQYCPSGPLANLLHNTKHRVYFNQPRNTPFPSSVHIWWDQTWTHTSTLYAHKKYIHAKFIIFTLPSGEKIALTGSHNFSYEGVLFGTREIALETTNTSIIEQLEQFCEDAIR